MATLVLGVVAAPAPNEGPHTRLGVLLTACNSTSTVSLTVHEEIEITLQRLNRAPACPNLTAPVWIEAAVSRLENPARLRAFRMCLSSKQRWSTLQLTRSSICGLSPT